MKMPQVFAKRVSARDVLPGERLAVWINSTFDLETEPPTFAEVVTEHPFHTEAEVVAEMYQAVSRGFLDIQYSTADQDIVYVLGLRLR